jgi:hypothetical protein
MANPSPLPLLERLAALELEVRDLRARLAALERTVNQPAEHAADRVSVREKAVYDWQAPR